MKYFISFVMFFHSCIHLLGFAKAFRLAAIESIQTPVSRLNGVIWLISSFTLFASLYFLIFDHSWWRFFGAGGIILSQYIIFRQWRDAKFGTVPNLIIAVFIIVTIQGCSSGYYEIYKSESERRLKPPMNTFIITEKHIAHMPEPVRRYLFFTGSVQKESIHNFRASFHGEMKREINGNWMDISAMQYEFFGDNTRMFYILSSMYGIPFDGLHAFIDTSARMQISVAGLFNVADARGDTMNISETVTLFNDMCLLAPASLIDSSIVWESIDSLTVRAWFTNKNITISAVLFFDPDGRLTNFKSDDRFLSEDGTRYFRYPWSTPVKEYSNISGRMIPTDMEALWDTPKGEFVYARFKTNTIEYNCVSFK